jgi:transglutaminase-like putative cysteine protease
MQIQLVRNFGMAARFVSGYFYSHLSNNFFELHAWLEVYLPGAGWIGFDPSNGILAGSNHIPICSSAHFQHTMPITGSFRGSASSSLQVSLSIETIGP